LFLSHFLRATLLLLSQLSKLWPLINTA
jgi:hypothetical protein